MTGPEANADRVHGIGFSYEVRIGIHEYERHIRQRVVVDFEAETNWRRAAQRDRAHNLVDYYEIHRDIGALVARKEWRLVEAMAEDIARLICEGYAVDRVRIKVTKQPFDMPNALGVAVECWRTPADFGDPETT